MAIKDTYETMAYPYMLIKNTYATIHTSASEDATISPNTEFRYITSGTYEQFPFKYLMKYNTTTFDTEDSFYMGVGYINYNYLSKIRQVPIDLIINNKAITDLSTFYKATNKSFSYLNTETDNKLIKHILKNEDINYIIKYLRLMNAHTLHETQRLFSSSGSVVYQLYNDKVDGEYYSRYIYRAKSVKSDIELRTDGRLYKKSQNVFAKIPVFRLETDDTDLQFYISVRNYRIPMKRVRTGSADGMTFYIFIYPEYIFKNYVEFSDSVTYLIANHGCISGKTYKFSYDYLDAAKQHLWLHDKESNENKNYGLKLGNTNSNITFRKVS